MIAPASTEARVRVLVTGGAGYVGAVSVERLLEAGHEVVILDDLSTGDRQSVPPTASIEVGSYGDPELMARLLERAQVDAILHCAARSLVGESLRDPARYYRDNVAGGIVLLDAARHAGVGRVVFSSTAAVYGVPDATPIPEEAPLRPINTYGETKRTFEGALRFYGEAYGLRSVALRYFNVAGATERNGELHDPETHLIPTILHAVETGDPVTLYGADYPTPGRDLHPRLHPCHGPRRRPPRRARGNGTRRPADGCGAGVQSRDRGGIQRASGRWTRLRRSSVGRFPRRRVRAGRAIRRCSSRHPSVPVRCWAGARGGPASRT